MMLKDLIKSKVSQNTFACNHMYNIFSKKRTNYMHKLCLEMSMLDTIADVSELKAFRKKIEDKTALFYTTDANYSNSHIYGIWKSLFPYLDSDDVIYSPSVEHGLIFHDQIFTDIKYTARGCCVTFSDFRKKIIMKNKSVPVFCVGPYIHYADSFYNPEHQAKMKSELGRTLLVFPMHSTDRSNIKQKSSDFLKCIEVLAKNFDTVIVNAYWWNINDPIIDCLASCGYKIVSAGFRDDTKFLSRLKTIISLADCAVGDSIGTHVGYCISMDVPFLFLKLRSKLQLIDNEVHDISIAENTISSIEKVFCNSKQITYDQKEIVRYYWGTDQIKTSEQLYNISEICRQIVVESRGNVKKFYDTAQHLYMSYNDEKYYLLKQALNGKH